MVAGIGGFGGQFPLEIGRFRAPVLVASTDGVGTKMVVARDSGRYDTVGIDLVAMCVDDLVCVGAEPLFMLDYIATGKVDPDLVATVVAGVHEGCRQAGCALIGGETAEHAGVMARDELDLAGFAVGVVEDGTQLGPERVRAGDAVIGLPSPGPALQRLHAGPPRAPRAAGLGLEDPAWAGADHSVADELLRPSVIYTPFVLALRGALGRRAARLCPHHRRRHRGQPPPGAAGRTWARCWSAGPGRSRGSSPRSRGWARWPRTRWTGCSTAASDGAGRRRRRGGHGAARAGGAGQPGSPSGRSSTGAGVRFT